MADNWISEAFIKAEENMAVREEQLKAALHDASEKEKKRTEEISNMLSGVGNALEKRKAAELKARQDIIAEEQAERVRQEDIALNGSNDYNDKEQRDSIKKLVLNLKK